jgi:hypothetical protein
LSYITKYDRLTGRLYYQAESDNIDQDLIDRIDFNNLILACDDKNCTKFLLQDGTMVMVQNSDPIALHASLLPHAPANFSSSNELMENKFSLELFDIHVSMKLTCSQCDGGSPHKYGYSFEPNGRISRFPEGSEGNATHVSTLNFLLSNDQAISIFNGISSIYKSYNEGVYKYIDYFQNCILLPLNTYRASGLPFHIAYFYTDEELIDRTFIGDQIFQDNLYHPANLLDPNRHVASAFMKEVYGDDYADKWKSSYLLEDGTYSELLSEQPIDLQKAMANPDVNARIDDIILMRREYYKEFTKLWSMDHDFTSEQIEPFVNREITNSDLYYTYVMKYELEMHKQLKELPYYTYLHLFPFGNDIAHECLKNQTIEYKPICQVFCTTMQDMKLLDANDPENYQDQQELNYICDKWFDRDMCNLDGYY